MFLFCLFVFTKVEGEDGYREQVEASAQEPILVQLSMSLVVVRV